MVLGFLESEILNREIVMEGMYAPIYIQEARNLVETINSAKDMDGFSGSFDIALCRLYEIYLSQGIQPAMFDHIVSVYDKGRVAKFFIESSEFLASTAWSLVPRDFWLRLLSEDTYRNQSAWEDFTRDTNSLVKESESILKKYCDWWLLGKEKKQSDPLQRMKETGLMDSSFNTTESEWKKFYGAFPSFYFAFSVLRRFQPNSDSINFIAVTTPYGTPYFSGYDLWLQRQAFFVSIKEWGVPFIAEHIQQIRLELIAYAVLRRWAPE